MLKVSRNLLIPLIIILSASIASNIYLLYQSIERYRVVKVIDGDSFDLKDGRRIRLLGLDAPERARCFYKEARNRLKDLVSGKIVRLSNVVTDDYGRILANVFVSSLFVNKIMVGEGFAKFIYVSSPYYSQLKEAFQLAKQEKRGIYSSICRKTEPEGKCSIKGNIRNGEKVYHLPSCKNYKQTIIDEAFGDRWFCSEEDAVKEGFRKAAAC